MADPRFYDNRGPVSVEALCAKLGVAVPSGADSSAAIYDVAGLAQAGTKHLAFFDGGRAKADFAKTRAGWCLVPEHLISERPGGGTVLITCASVAASFAATAALFYPDDLLGVAPQERPVHPTARIADDVVLCQGVVIGQYVEIGRNTRVGPNTAIGRGVTIGRNCEIGANVWIGYAHFGDDVVVLPGARIGAPGFGFTPTPAGHLKMPQLGRVIVQDRVEIGANTAVDRGALGDTVVGEGTKIDNLVQIGHNCVVGRHCVIAGSAGLAGSVTLGDYVVIGGASGIADHVVIGSGARIAGMSGVVGNVPAGQDYGGILARPMREWHKESATLSRLAKTRRHKNKND